jgi:hypothetical protein
MVMSLPAMYSLFSKCRSNAVFDDDDDDDDDDVYVIITYSMK